MSGPYPNWTARRIVRICVKRMAMVVQDAPRNLAYLSDGLPIPCDLDAVGLEDATQIIDQMVLA